MIPCQLVTGVIMIILAARMDELLPEGGTPNVPGLFAAFLCLYFLVATQDIAVDGWALTLLRPENVGYASTANTVGQGVGIQVAFSLLLNLDSADVCNTYIRPALGLPPAATGILSLGGFLWGWGVVFLVVTLIVWGVQREGPASEGYSPVAPSNDSELSRVISESDDDKEKGTPKSTASTASHRSSLRLRPKSNSRSGSEESEKKREGGGSDVSISASSAATTAGPNPATTLPASSNALTAFGSVYASYLDFFNVCLLPNVILLALVLFTVKAGFATVDSTTSFVLQNRGVPKETLAFIDTISFPLQLLIQVRSFYRTPMDALFGSHSENTLPPPPSAVRFFSWRG